MTKHLTNGLLDVIFSYNLQIILPPLPPEGRCGLCKPESCLFFTSILQTEHDALSDRWLFHFLQVNLRCDAAAAASVSLQPFDLASADGMCADASPLLSLG